jgi:outer membrane protein, heavy metal efflux system
VTNWLKLLRRTFRELSLSALVTGLVFQFAVAAYGQTPVAQRIVHSPAASRTGQAEQLPPPTTIARPEPDPLSLADLVAIAEQNNPLLAQAAAEIEMAQGRTRQAALYPNPVLQGGGMQLGGRESQYYAMLSQEIVTHHKLQISRAAAGQQVTQAELRFIRARFDLLTRVRKGYAAVVAADQRVIVLTKLVELARKSEQAADRLFQAGLGARPDAILFEIELEKAEVALENSQVAAAGARRQLAAIVGLRDLQVHQLTGSLQASFQRLSEEIAVDDYVPKNADVLYAEAEVERTQLLAQRAEVEPYPNVTVNAGYMRQVQGVENMALLNLSLPIPTWNRNQGNIRAARAEVSRAVEGVRQSQNEVARQMADAIARFRAAKQQAARYEKRIMPKASEGVRLIQQGFETGEFDFQRLLQAQRSLVEADLGNLGALTEQWNAAADLAGLAQVEVFP